MRIFEKNGSYTGDFRNSTGYNMLVGPYWQGQKRTEEDEQYKIRLSEVYPFDWKGEPLPKYMKKPYFEEMFRIKLKPEERSDPELLVAFYIYGDYGQIGGIFDTRKLLLLPRISNLMEKKYGLDWIHLSISLLAIEE